MSQQSTDIQDFASSVRRLIRSYEDVKAENAKLKEIVVEKDNKISELIQTLSEEKDKYEKLMDAKILNIADGNLENARKRINDLIRTVNQCITLLNER